MGLFDYLKSSMSPAKSDLGSPPKRKRDHSPTKQMSQHNGTSNRSKKHKADVDPDAEQPFKFEEVKLMIDRILESQTRRQASISSGAGLRQIDFDEIAVPGHSVDACKKLVENLINATRRTRTLEEILSDVKNNLKKQIYTNVIMRASITKPLPKRPATAYLLFHKDRYDHYRDTVSKAAEIAKLVSDEWKNLSDKQRQKYIDEHNKLMKAYSKECKKFGLNAYEKPKRARSARALYALNKLDEITETQGELEKDEIKRLMKQYQDEYENLDAETKAHWTREHMAEKERYRRERSEYISANPHLDHQVVERTRARKETVKPPEPPKSAFKFFLAKKLPEGLEGQELDETKHKLKEKFAKLSDKKQIKLIKKALQDRNRYEEELAEFRKTYPDFVVPKFKTNISKDQMKLYESIIEKKPSIPAPTAYLHFCGGILAGEVNTDSSTVPTQRMQSASIAWTTLSEQDKLAVEREHLTAIKEYIDKMEDWMSKQDEQRQEQVRKDEPRNRPEYWRRRLARMEKSISKREKEHQ